MHQAGLTGEGEERQSQGDQGHHALGDEQDPAAVGNVGEGATDEREDDDRQDAGQPDAAQGDGLVGEGADVPEERPDLHLAAGERDQQAEPEQAVFAVAEGWGEVEGHSG